MIDDKPIDAAPQQARTSWWAHLVSALLISVITVLGILLAIAGLEASSLKKELRQLRSEAGHLVISDANKVYAVRIPTADPYEWAWRIYLPPNHSYRLFSYRGRMPAIDKSRDVDWRQVRRAGSGTSGGIQSGEFVFRVKLHEDQDEQWVTTTISPHGWGSMGQKPRTDWLARRDWEETSDVPGEQQREFAMNAAFELLCLRHESAVDANDPLRETETLVVWITGEPQTSR